MEHLYLSRKNLLILLSKLDRIKEGGASFATIVKYKNPDDPFPNALDVLVTAVEDENYYKDREAGEMWPEDEDRIR
jgi:hypothetical protein